MKFEEKLGYIQRGLQRRLDNLPAYKKNREEQLVQIKKSRKEITDRIEKYKDDEVLLRVLNGTLTEFDRQYKDVPIQYQTAIHEAERSLKYVQNLHDRIANLEFDKDFLEMIIETFLNNVVLDWKAYEEMEEDSQEEVKDNERKK